MQIQTTIPIEFAHEQLVFLEISQNSQENTGARDSFLIKLQALGPHYCYSVGFPCSLKLLVKTLKHCLATINAKLLLLI